MPKSWSEFSGGTQCKLEKSRHAEAKKKKKRSIKYNAIF